jgi:hypothetical protein
MWAGHDGEHEQFSPAEKRKITQYIIGFVMFSIYPSRNAYSATGDRNTLS